MADDAAAQGDDVRPNVHLLIGETDDPVAVLVDVQVLLVDHAVAVAVGVAAGIVIDAGVPYQRYKSVFERRGFPVFDGMDILYVADTGNSRIQIFDASGDYDLLFGNPEDTPAPISLGTVDVVSDPANNVINFGAFVFVLLEGQGQVVKYISADHYNDINTGEPPPE